MEIPVYRVSVYVPNKDIRPTIGYVVSRPSLVRQDGHGGCCYSKVEIGRS